MPKNVETATQLHSFHTLPRQCVSQELPDVQSGFTKGWGTRDKIAIIHWIIEKAKRMQKKKEEKIYFCFIDYAEVFDCMDNKKLENS